MRDYEKEATELEGLLSHKGILNPDTAHLSLVKLVNFYGVAYMQYGPLDHEVVAAHAKAAPLPWEEDEEPTKAVKPARKLSEDQEAAWAKLRKWAVNSEPYFVLRGFAGTGKTYLLQLLNQLPVSIYYSAPTNKAAKVLGKAVGRQAKTTYSMLGLRMEQQEDELVLTPSSNPPYFPSNSILVIDEGSMSGKQLCAAVEEARARCNIKILYVGDPAQLPPVGELRSPAWRATNDPDCKAMLKKVVRYDNQLLVLATALRGCIKNKDWHSPLRSDHTDSGIWKWKSQEQFEHNLLARVAANEMGDSKVIAWRNKTVNRYNDMIRKQMGFTDLYCVGDILLLAEPIEDGGTLIAHTDDEFKITEVSESKVVIDGGEIDVWQLHVTGDQSLILDIAKDQAEVDAVLARKARIARKSNRVGRRMAWRDFWETKARFNKVRYGYALTAHRAQGSTYTNVWLDQMDILANPNKREAFRCFYVAATRPTTNLYSY
jgi:exodeoxyribonuclease-5